MRPQSDLKTPGKDMLTNEIPSANVVLLNRQTCAENKQQIECDWDEVQHATRDARVLRSAMQTLQVPVFPAERKRKDGWGRGRDTERRFSKITVLFFFSCTHGATYFPLQLNLQCGHTVLWHSDEICAA